jgi:uncharacterized protein
MPELTERAERDELYTKFREGEPGSKTALTLVDGSLFDVTNPDTWVFELDTIATSLSNLCRFNGQIRNFYSVAEHSVRVSKQLEEWGEPPEVQYLGLHHDDVESVIGDIPSPQKGIMTIDGEPIREVEESIEYAFFASLGLLDTYINRWDAVKRADLAVYLLERAERPIMGRGLVPADAKMEYLNRHASLLHDLLDTVEPF